MTYWTSGNSSEVAQRCHALFVCTFAASYALRNSHRGIKQNLRYRICKTNLHTRFVSLVRDQVLPVG